jgi:hypothetical protein
MVVGRSIEVGTRVLGASGVDVRRRRKVWSNRVVKICRSGKGGFKWRSLSVCHKRPWFLLAYSLR